MKMKINLQTFRGFGLYARRFLCALLSALLVLQCLSFFPGGPFQMAARAEDGVAYLDENGTATTRDGVTVIGGESVEWTGWLAVTGEVTISERITVNGTANLILCDGAKLNASAGITVASGDALHIYCQQSGTGQLLANANILYAAGIGGKENQAGGHIVINGGSVTANGNEKAAGIGGGKGQPGGHIVINGGSVTANGGANAAGIGGGNKGAGGSIEINGGTVTAQGGEKGAGIGGGNSGTGGTVSINQGTVTSRGGEDGAGIGGGYKGAGGGIQISQGTITAEGGACAAGIGGGFGGTGGVIIIRQGIIIANGGKSGAGIGGGSLAAGGTITIADGTVTATGGEEGAGIGGGTGTKGEGGNISISGGMVTATGGAYAAGIGGRIGKNGEGGNISISGGTVIASVDTNKPGNAQAIGHGNSDSSSGSLNLVRMKVTAGENPASATPVTGGGWVDACRGKYVYLQECEPHSYDSNGICMICGASEQPENVNPPISYKTSDGSMLSRTDWEQITDSTAAMNASRCQWYTAAGKVLNNHRIEVTGDVNLILCDDAELNLPQGLHVPGGASLTVWTQSAGSGKMSVQSTNMAAGIGGNNGERGGQFIVNGGNITVNAGKYAAGIGGGYQGSGGNITINAGTVIATGGEEGAGIGGGLNGAGGACTINGGTVTATGGSKGAGIGGGSNCAGGACTINAGTVTATGGSSGAGIGGGKGGDGISFTMNGGTVNIKCDKNSVGIGGSKTSNDQVTINGGSLNIKGAGIGIGCIGPSTPGKITINGGSILIDSELAGIGGGQFKESKPGTGGEITIRGATVTVNVSKGANNAGIGNGPYSTGGTVTIEDSNVNVFTPKGSAGIGCGDEGTGGTISIRRSSVTANGNGAGIGGWTGSGGQIRIEESQITASCTGNAGAGIGGGKNGSGGEITITDSRITADSSGSGASIGGGKNGSGGVITIRGGAVQATSETSGAGIGGGKNGAGGTILIREAEIQATGGKNGGAGIGGGLIGDTGSITIDESKVTARATGKTSAGIGGGADAPKASDGGTITIRGGQIITESAAAGCGIGPGSYTKQTYRMRGIVTLDWTDHVNDFIQADGIAAGVYHILKPFHYQSPEGADLGAVTADNLAVKNDQNRLIPDTRQDAEVTVSGGERSILLNEGDELNPQPGTTAFTAEAACPGEGTGVWTWQSDNPEIAQITGTGNTAVVTAVSAGTTRIRAFYESDTTLGEGSAALAVVTHYTVSAADSENGTVTANPANAMPGDTVTLTVTPDTDYHIASLAVFCGEEEVTALPKSETDRSEWTFTMPHGDVTVAALFCQYNLITFVDDDGENVQILQQLDLPDGSIPVYSGPELTREADAEFTYSFAGWDPEITEDTRVTGDATYTAVFAGTVRSYQITFLHEDGTVLQQSDMEYGEMPVYEGATPVKPTDASGKSYAFSGWTPEAESVTGEATYTAVFEEVFTLQTGLNTISIGDGETVTLSFIPDTDGCYRFTNDACAVAPMIRVYSEDGLEKWGTWTIWEGGMYTFDCAAELTAGKTCMVEIQSWDGSADINLHIERVGVHTITWDNTSEHGRIQTEYCLTSAYVGQRVEVYAEPEDGYAWSGSIICDEDGNEIEKAYHFVMPDCNVVVKATFTKTHRILFKLDDMVGEPILNVEGRMWNWEDAQALPGETVNMLLYCTKEGYEIDDAVITTESGRTIPCYLSADDDNEFFHVEDGFAWEYWFDMPDEPVFVRVIRTRSEEEPEPEPDPEFEGGGLEMPAGILEIEESAFEGDRSIFVVDIPAGCRRIGKWAFRNCTSLWMIRIPNGCEVDDEAFEGCGSVYLFGPPLGTAYYYCLEHDGCGFVEE